MFCVGRGVVMYLGEIGRGRVAAWSIAFLAMSLWRPGTARAWTLAEHSYIGEQAVQDLPSAANGLAQLWEEVRAHYGHRLPLCPDIAHRSVTSPYDPHPAAIACVAFADLPALAADHSCSPGNLHDILVAAATERNLGSSRRTLHWLFRVIVDAQYSRYNLTNAGGFPQSGDLDRYLERRDDNRDDLNFDLTIHDPDYIDRAAANYAHFQLPRATAGESFDAWISRMVDHGAPLANAAAYSAYHVTALRLATEYGSAVRAGTISPSDRAAHAWSVLLNEAFALHFLEDAFAAGHFVDFFRESNLRNGTHDYYCSHGADAVTWNGPVGSSRRAFGDAHMTQGDVAATSAAVRASLEMVQAALGPDAPALPEMPGLSQSPAEFDICTARNPPAWLATVPSLPQLTSVMRQTPMPSMQGHRVSGSREYRNDRGVSLQLGTRAQGQYDLLGVNNEQNPWRFRILGEVGVAFNVDSVMSGYRDGNIIQVSGLLGYEVGAENGLSGGFRVRLPILPFLISSVRVPTSSAIRTSVPFYAAMLETKWCLATRTGPQTSMFAVNLNEVSVLWGPRGTTVQVPLIYYLLRGARPNYSSNEFAGRFEVGLSLEFVRDSDTYFGIFAGFNPTYRRLAANLGPQ